ncbi:hypothetical protein [Vibrio crassostreae]|uniref:hypothetical protein n=1 Tax=Vibrio crassostreae TaxID=246167 RepID=UPI001B3033D8|nr:hypothetical protein [Vibrio crassostreae]
MARKYYINNKTSEICFKKRYKFNINAEHITYALACHVSTFGELNKEHRTRGGILSIVKHFIATNGYINLEIINTDKISYDDQEVEAQWELAKSIATEVFTEGECKGFNVEDTYNIYGTQLEKVVAMELYDTPTEKMSEKKINDLLFSRINNLGYANYRAFDDSVDHFDNADQEEELVAKAKVIVERIYPRLYNASVN